MNRKQLVIFSVVLLAVIGGPLYVYRAYLRSFERLESFNALWQVHDMITSFAIANDRWPRCWNEMEGKFEEVNRGGYGVPDIVWLRDRIEVNFDVDLQNGPFTEDAWFVRARRHNLVGEEDAANQRLRRMANRMSDIQNARAANP